MHRCTFVRHPCVFGHQHKTLKSLKYTAATLSSWSSSVSVSDSYNRQMCSPFCPVLHQHLSSVFIDILPKKPSLHLNVCPSLFSKGSFYKVKRLVAAAAHLSCCFWVSRPCWMQINKIQSRKFKMHECQIPVLLNLCHAEEARTNISLHFSSQIKWVTKRQNLASASQQATSASCNM